MLAMEIITLTLLLSFPSITLFLPNLMIKEWNPETKLPEADHETRSHSWNHEAVLPEMTGLPSSFSSCSITLINFLLRANPHFSTSQLQRW